MAVVICTACFANGGSLSPGARTAVIVALSVILGVGVIIPAAWMIGIRMATGAWGFTPAAARARALSREPGEDAPAISAFGNKNQEDREAIGESLGHAQMVLDSQQPGATAESLRIYHNSLGHSYEWDDPPPYPPTKARLRPLTTEAGYFEEHELRDMRSVFPEKNIP